MGKISTFSSKGEAYRFVGLDVHKDTIAVAVADGEGARSVGIIANDFDQLRKTLRKLGSPSQLRVCYEAGACGYVIYRYLRRLKIDCAVVAPSLIPKKPGDRVKTDRRDALALARLHRSDDLTAVWVPDSGDEALRDLVRAREDCVEDRQRARHRLTKFLLRQGIVAPAGTHSGTLKYQSWLAGLQWKDQTQHLVFSEYRQRLEELQTCIKRFDRAISCAVPSSQHAPTIMALQAMRGVKELTAVTVMSEVGDLTRFKTPRQAMAYAGLVPSERSSGGRTRRGGITKTGNAHLRRVLIESAWHYRHAPAISGVIRQRQDGLPPQVCEIAWSAQQRLNKRYRKLCARGKIQQQVVVAVARELLAFAWAIAHSVRAAASTKIAA
jgi:transposase